MIGRGCWSPLPSVFIVRFRITPFDSSQIFRKLMNQYEVLKTETEPLTRKSQCRKVLGWRFFLRGVCAPLIPTYCQLSARIYPHRKAWVLKECILFAQYWSWFPMMPSRTPRRPLAGFKQEIWGHDPQLLIFSNFYCQSLCQNSEFIDKKLCLPYFTWCSLPLSQISLNECMHESVNEQTGVCQALCLARLEP